MGPAGFVAAPLVLVVGGSAVVALTLNAAGEGAFLFVAVVLAEEENGRRRERSNDEKQRTA